MAGLEDHVLRDVNLVVCPPTRIDSAFYDARLPSGYRTMQIADNAGATDEHRALNYLAVSI